MAKINITKNIEPQTIYTRPGESVDLKIDLSKSKIDILGSDIVITKSGGKKIILSGMAVNAFAEDPAKLIVNGKVVDPNTILSQVGIVQSVSGKDVAALTSMQAEKEKNTEINDNKKSEKDVKVIEKVVEKKVVEIVEVDKKNTSPTETFEVKGPSTTQSNATNFLAKYDKKVDSLLSTKTGDFNRDNTFEAPRVQYHRPAFQSKYVPPKEDDGSGFGNGMVTLTTSAKLLQMAGTSLVSGYTLTVTGGSGSRAASLNGDSPVLQIQEELINTSSFHGATIINADDSQFISTNLLTRVLQYTPIIPGDYSLTQLKISGLPSNFSLKGLTPDGNGDYIINSNELGGGIEKFLLQYDPTQFSGAKSDIDGDGIASEYQSFTITISSVAQNTGVNALSLTEPLTDTLIIPVIVKDTTSTDYSYTVGGVKGWVLDVKPNDNIIITGQGDSTIYGGLGVDFVTTGEGNDTIYGYAGNDFIRTGKGNDFIDVGTGNNKVEGGDGSDTLSYDGRTEDIPLNLSGATNVDGYFEVILSSGQTDQIRDIENIITGSGNDSIIGDSLVNNIQTGAGNDTIIGYGGNDVLDGGAGNDTVSYSYVSGTGVVVDLTANSGNAGINDTDYLVRIENVIGSNQNDTLLGDGNNNTLTGGLGDDLLNGRTGNDILDGGDGNDTVSFDGQTGGVTITLVDSGDAIGSSTSGDVITVRYVENVIGSSFDDNFGGNSGNNIFSSSAGNDGYNGGGGNDTLTYALYGAPITVDLVAGTVGKDLGQVDNFSNIETLVTTESDDLVLGGGSVTLIDGNAGYNTLSYQNSTSAVTIDMANGSVNGAYNQSFLNFQKVIGGSGNDIFISSSSDDNIDGGGGTNTINYSSATSSVDVDLTAGTATGLSVGTDTLTNIQKIIGSNYGGILKGSTGNDEIIGGSYVDSILGSLGNDTIDGGAGNNSLSYDLLGIKVVSTSYTANPGYTTITFDNGKVDKVKNFANLTGGDADDTIGGGGSSGGGFGGGVIDGGGGNSNTITFEAETNPVTASLLTGTASGTNNSGDPWSLTFTNFQNLIGGSGDDILTGNNSTILANTINGGAGNDIIIGTLGADILNGEGGTNTVDYTNITSLLMGSAGITITPTSAIVDGFTQTLTNFAKIIATGKNDIINDTGASINYDAGAGNDTVNAGLGDDFFDGGLGIDTISYVGHSGGSLNVNMSSVDANNYFTVTIGSEIDKVKNFETFIASSANDTIIGSTVADIIYGGAGNDTINGGAGNDGLYGDAGNDTINGGAGNDTINGGAGNDILYGDDGNDIITDIDGVNTTYGGLGDDIIYAAINGNTIYGDGGTDTLNYNGSTVSNLTFAMNDDGTGTVTDGTKTDNFSGFEVFYGSSGNDTFIGNSSANIFYGNSGSNIFRGRGGVDIFYGGSDSDTADYSLADGGVTATLSGVSPGASNDGDGSTDTFVSIENITGSNFADTLTGGSGNNLLFGGSGNDTFNASSGSDTINGDAGTTDTLNYTSFSTALTFNLGAGQVVKSDGTGTDNYSFIEVINGGSGSDNVSATAASLFSNTINFNTGSGSDTITITSGAIGQSGFDASNLNTYFDNVEKLDFRSATLSSGQKFDINALDIIGLTGSSRTLSLHISNAFGMSGLNVTAGAGYAVESSASGYTFTNTTTPSTKAYLNVYLG